MRLDDTVAGTVAIGDLRVRRLGYGAMRVSGARNAAGVRDRAEAIRILVALVSHALHEIRVSR